ACVSCGSRPFAEGGSRDLTVVTSLPPDAPEVLLLRAVLERPAIRIEDETAYAVRMATPSDARVYRARTVLFLGYGRTQVPGPLPGPHADAGRPRAHLPSARADARAGGPDPHPRGAPGGAPADPRPLGGLGRERRGSLPVLRGRPRRKALLRGSRRLRARPAQA